MSGSLYAGAARRVINPPIGTGKTGVRLFGGPIQLAVWLTYLKVAFLPGVRTLFTREIGAASIIH